jgi:hypothetical protein
VVAGRGPAPIGVHCVTQSMVDAACMPGMPVLRCGLTRCIMRAVAIAAQCDEFDRSLVAHEVRLFAQRELVRCGLRDRACDAIARGLQRLRPRLAILCPRRRNKGMAVPFFNRRHRHDGVERTSGTNRHEWAWSARLPRIVRHTEEATRWCAPLNQSHASARKPGWSVRTTEGAMPVHAGSRSPSEGRFACSRSGWLIVWMRMWSRLVRRIGLPV